MPVVISRELKYLASQERRQATNDKPCSSRVQAHGLSAHACAVTSPQSRTTGAASQACRAEKHIKQLARATHAGLHRRATGAQIPQGV